MVNVIIVFVQSVFILYNTYLVLVSVESKMGMVI